MSNSTKRSASALVDHLLQAGREATPVRYDVDAGLTRHRGLVHSGALVPDWANAPKHAAAAKAAATLASKTVIGAIVAAAVGVSIWTHIESHQPVHPGARPSPNVGVAEIQMPRRPTPASPGSADHTSSVIAFDSLQRVPSEALVQAPRDDNRSRQLEGERIHAASPSSDPLRVEPRREQLPSDAVSLETRAAAPSSSVADTETRVLLPSSDRNQAAPAPTLSGVGGGPGVSEEVAQVAAAEHLLVSNPNQALVLARAADVRFPNGFLREERRYIEVMALLQIGNTEQARQDAQRFLRDYPSDPYARRVRARLNRGSRSAARNQ